jgi:hypothetical protein
MRVTKIRKRNIKRTLVTLNKYDYRNPQPAWIFRLYSARNEAYECGWLFLHTAIGRFEREEGWLIAKSLGDSMSFEVFR